MLNTVKLHDISFVVLPSFVKGCHGTNGVTVVFFVVWNRLGSLQNKVHWSVRCNEELRICVCVRVFYRLCGSLSTLWFFGVLYSNRIEYFDQNPKVLKRVITFFFFFSKLSR